MIDDGSGVPIEPLECYLNIPDKMENPLAMQDVKWYQDQCQELHQLRMQNPQRYKNEIINGVSIVTYQNLQFKDEQQWKVYLPRVMANQVIKWYYFALGHCRTQRLYNMISNRFYLKGLNDMCNIRKINSRLIDVGTPP